MASEYPELSFSLSSREAGVYKLELRFQKPGSPVEVDPAAGKDLTVQINPAELKILEETPADYGRKLSQSLFAAQEARDAFREAQTLAEADHLFLRLRLLIGSDALELHQLRWETLFDPDGTAPLFESKVLFSRFLHSASYTDFKLPPKHQLRALVAVSNPSDLEEFSLDPVMVSDEFERARLALKGIEVEVLGGEAGPVTLDGLARRLDQGRFDILYLVAHGITRKDESILWLQDEQGKSARVTAQALADEIKKLDRPPLLAALLACESAKQETSTALTAAGPKLAAAGIPAVLAMQAKISMETGEKFMPVFFQDLLASGIVDHAVAVARNAVRTQPDAWMPVLYTRLKTGMIYGDAPLEAQVTRQVGKLNRNLVWIAGVVVALLLGLIGFNAWQSGQTEEVTVKPTATPSQMSGNFNVAIAEFTPVDQNGKKVDLSVGKDLSKYMYTELLQKFSEMPATLRPQTWGPELTGGIEGTTPTERQKVAQARAEAINAHVLIYGQVVQAENGGQFSPEFVVNYKGFADNAPEVTGGNLLGKALFVNIPFNPVDAVTGENPALIARSEALGLITVGLAYYAFDNYPKAEEYFQKAIDLPNWLASDGKELAYLLHGNALSRQASIAKNFDRLPEALNDYDTAWVNTNRTYGRALIGKGGILYLEALRNPLDPSKDTIDQERLQQAEDLFKQALALKNQPDSYNIPSKANFSLGQVYQLRGQILGEAGMSEEAIKAYENVTKAYECSTGADVESCGAKNIREIASFAYARLGLLYALDAEPNYPLALENYQKAFAIASPFFRSEATFSQGVIQLQMALDSTGVESDARVDELLATAQKTLEEGVQRAQTLSKQELIDEFAPFLAYTYIEQGKQGLKKNDEITARDKFQAAEALLTRVLALAQLTVDDPSATWYVRDDMQSFLAQFKPLLEELQSEYKEYLANPVE